MKVKKAIIPAAGLGTRMLPATKSVPKEMLTIVDRPVIQYIVEEAIASGISEILMAISKGKKAIQDHFASDFPNAPYYEQKGKHEVLEKLRGLAGDCEITFVEQEELKGLGDAVYCGKEFAGNDPFAVLLGDAICQSATDRPVLGQLIDVFDQQQSSVVAVQEVPLEKVSRYGIMDGTLIDEGTYRVNQWVEKPSVKAAPSRLAIAARYVFTPEIFHCLENTTVGYGNEIQLTDAMHQLLETQESYAVKFQGTRFDVGNPLDFVKANLHFVSRHEEYGAGFKD
ncbi:MAG: UTP--glucose-1-phosphate uridylyltransferase GalU [Cytophagales bacterium]|nr:UTP--glucose-1-phosphate uridylyltransferase GalU [Cytophagales bacterium]